VWWLVDPGGARTFSRGVNVVSAEPDKPPRRGGVQYEWKVAHPSPEAWAAVTRARLLAWGFDTLGGFSLREAELALPYTAVLSVGQAVNAIWGDPFDPATPGRMLEEARRRVARHPGGPHRIGYFSDNEIGWWNAPLLFHFLAQPPGSHTRRELVAWLRGRYASFDALRRDFAVPEGIDSFDALSQRPARLRLAAGGDGIATLRGWTRILAERYYAAAERAVRGADPGALVLGDRLPIYWDEDALAALRGRVDAVSANVDAATPQGWVAPYFFEGIRDGADAPVLVSEWFFAARENRSGNANRGQLMTVDTQAERARGAATAARRFAGFPNVVGLHWFQYADQPPGGRADGEDYSHGLVDVRDVPYGEFTQAMASVNAELPELHARARWPSPPQAEDEIEIPRASPRADAGDASLADWDLAATRLRFPRGAASRGDVPFADVHLAFQGDALQLALLGQDYFSLADYERDELLPGDAFAVHLIAEVRGARRHVALELVPRRLEQPSDFPPNEQRVEVYEPAGVVYVDGAAQPAPEVRARRLRAIAPRADAEAQVPARLLGLDALAPGEPFAFEVVVVGFVRGRAFSLSGRSGSDALAGPPARIGRLAPLSAATPEAARPASSPSGDTGR
jgi:hypothetical protein